MNSKKQSLGKLESCLLQLGLSSTKMTRAVENLLTDMFHRQGNVKGALTCHLMDERKKLGCVPTVGSPCSRCSKTAQFVEKIQACQTVLKPKLRTPIARPVRKLLRCCMTTIRFLKYHYSNPLSASNMLFYNDFKTSLIEGRNPFHLKTRVGRSWRIALALENLEGGTHQMSPPKPAWWSFDGSSSSFPPVAAGDYMKELGLSDLDITDAKAAGYAVVVEVPTESFGEVEFYKPCALDNFIEDSNFCPDCTTAPHGWTRHRVTNQKGHPELISEPMQYSEFTGSQVNIYLIPYHAPSSGTTP